MFCPQCRAEYRPGFFECADCHVALVSHLPEPAPPLDADDQPFTGDFDILIRTGLQDPVAIALLKSLFEEAEIPFIELDQNPVVQQDSGNIFGSLSVRVPREREAEAREILRSVV